MSLLTETDICENPQCHGAQWLPRVPHIHVAEYEVGDVSWWVRAVYGAEERVQLELPGFDQ